MQFAIRTKVENLEEAKEKLDLAGYNYSVYPVTRFFYNGACCVKCDNPPGDYDECYVIHVEEIYAGEIAEFIRKNPIVRQL